MVIFVRQCKTKRYLYAYLGGIYFLAASPLTWVMPRVPQIVLGRLYPRPPRSTARKGGSRCANKLNLLFLIPVYIRRERKCLVYMTTSPKFILEWQNHLKFKIKFKISNSRLDPARWQVTDEIICFKCIQFVPTTYNWELSRMVWLTKIQWRTIWVHQLMV